MKHSATNVAYSIIKSYKVLNKNSHKVLQAYRKERSQNSSLPKSTK